MFMNTDVVTMNFKDFEVSFCCYWVYYMNSILNNFITIGAYSQNALYFWVIIKSITVSLMPKNLKATAISACLAWYDDTS